MKLVLDLSQRSVIRTVYANNVLHMQFMYAKFDCVG